MTDFRAGRNQVLTNHTGCFLLCFLTDLFDRPGLSIGRGNCSLVVLTGILSPLRYPYESMVYRVSRVLET